MRELFSKPDVSEQFVWPELNALDTLEEGETLLYTLIHRCATVMYIFLQLIPAGLVDVSVPHLLIVVQFLSCSENSWTSVFKFQ